MNGNGVVRNKRKETTMDKVKYPEITVELIGQNGNIFNLIGICTQALRRAKVSKAERDIFVEEVTHAGSYVEALAVIMRWVNVE